MIGRTVSHYRIVGQLGAGGMGVVYAAEDDRLGRKVALKFAPEDLAEDLNAIERLRSEARTASGLNHPNICTIFDIGEYEGRPFIAMELLDGRTLRDRVATGPLKVPEVLELGIQVADALDVAHQRGIVHRDIKPANLFLGARGHVKVLDFGLAKLVTPKNDELTTVGATRDQTAAGTTLGTVAYMSPEQVTGDELDGRTDLFSLGVVLYECLTGRQPFTGKTSAVIFSAILTQAPVAPVVFNPEMPLRLQDVVNNCLEKNRELRYQDASALRADLKRIKRDLESGRSGVFRLPAASAASGAPTGGVASGDVPAVDVRPAGDSSKEERAPVRSGARPSKLAAAIAATALAITAAIYLWPRERTASTLADSAPAPVAPQQEAAKAVPPAPAVEPPPPARELPPPPSGRSTPSEPKREAERPRSTPPLHDQRPPPSVSDAPRVAPFPQEAPTPPSPPPAPAPSTPGPAAPAAVDPSTRPPVAIVPAVPETLPLPQAAPRTLDVQPRAEPHDAPAAAARSVESDDTLIRRLVQTYAHAIETKDIALFRSVKPNLSSDEQRRVEEGFRAVTSQRVDVTVLSIDVRGAQDASVRLKRRDTIQAGGRQQTAESEQTMRLTRTAAGWVIRDIGR